MMTSAELNVSAQIQRLTLKVSQLERRIELQKRLIENQRATLVRHSKMLVEVLEKVLPALEALENPTPTLAEACFIHSVSHR